MKNRWIIASFIGLPVIVIIAFIAIKTDNKSRDHLAMKVKSPSQVTAIEEKKIAGHSSPSDLPEKMPLLNKETVEPIAENEDNEDENRKEITEETTEDDAQKELDYQMREMFKEEAMEFLPLQAVVTHDPRNPDRPRSPREGEIWIRIKPENSGETRDIMAQVADLYRDVARYDEPVTVILWVGGRPWVRFRYPQEE